MSAKRVLVTGGSGFLGSALVTYLQSCDWCAEVIAPTSEQYDLRDKDAVIRMYEDCNPEVVLHLAGRVGGIGANKDHPAEFFYDNLTMGVQTMHEAYTHGVAKFVAVGTICAYPKNTPVPFREDNLWNGYPEETNAPYGLAKRMLLVQAQTYREQYGFNAIYLLPVNLYGPGDNFDLQTSHVIPALIRKFSEAKEKGENTVSLWGDGSPTREFLYVDDAARGISLAAEKYSDQDPVNLGTGKEIAIRDLATLIAEAVGYEGEIVWDKSKPNGQPRRCLDVSRAKERFGFEATTPFEEGIAKTVAWYEANRDSVREVQFTSS